MNRDPIAVQQCDNGGFTRLTARSQSSRPLNTAWWRRVSCVEHRLSERDQPQGGRRSAASIHRGVYAVGHNALERRGWWMAAVLSGGPKAVLSHRPAGSRLEPARLERAGSDHRRLDGAARSPDRGPLRRPARRRGHRLRDGIPITTVPRTLLDLATDASTSTHLLNAVNEAEQQELGDALSLPALLERHQGERGSAKLREALLDAGSASASRAGARGALRSVRRRAGSPAPGAQRDDPRRRDRFYELDCLWRGQRLIVELQGAKFHGTPIAWPATPTASGDFCCAGWRVIEVTWSHLRTKPRRDALEVDLRRRWRRRRVG